MARYLQACTVFGKSADKQGYMVSKLSRGLARKSFAQNLGLRDVAGILQACTCQRT
jgi:hypothetical protein